MNFVADYSQMGEATSCKRTCTKCAPEIHPAHDFGVKLSSCRFSHIVAALTDSQNRFCYSISWFCAITYNILLAQVCPILRHLPSEIMWSVDLYGLASLISRPPPF